MKKICIISPYAYPLLINTKGVIADGGAEAQLTTIGYQLSKNGYEVHFIVDDYGQDKTVVSSGIYIHKVALKYMGGPNYYLPFAWIELWRRLYRIDAEIHLIKLPRALLFPLVIFCKWRKKKSIFIGQIDSDTDPKVLKKTENIFSYWFFRIGLYGIDYVVAQNEKQKLGFLNSYNKKALIIKSIITLPEKKIRKKEGYILWVGNNLRKKQPKIFLKLAKALPEYRFKMIMSLQKPTDSDRFIKDELGTIPNLEYIGYIPFSNISKFFQTASLFVSTSIREGFPNTFLQSWQYCTPVVTLNVDPDGLIKKINLGRCSQTFEQLCDDVRELMEKDTLRKEMGKNARDYVYKNHSTKEVTAQYLKVIQACS